LNFRLIIIIIIIHIYYLIISVFYLKATRTRGCWACIDAAASSLHIYYLGKVVFFLQKN